MNEAFFWRIFKKFPKIWKRQKMPNFDEKSYFFVSH